MRWIGIDPGSQAVGLAVIEEASRHYRLLRSEALYLPAKPLTERLPLIYTWVREQVQGVIPAKGAAIEAPFVGRSVRSALTLGIVQGLIWGVLIEQGIPLITLSPAEIKRAITGRAHASKEQVAATLRHHLTDEPRLPDSDHATDAIAIALAAAYHQNSPITRRLTRRAER